MLCRVICQIQPHQIRRDDASLKNVNMYESTEYKMYIVSGQCMTV